MDKEMQDGITYTVCKQAAEQSLVCTSKLAGMNIGSFVDTFEQEFIRNGENKAKQLLAENDTVEIGIAGYKEVVPLLPKDSCPTGARRKGFIYIISDGRAVKIGQSDTPEKRYAELQVGNPYKLVTLQEIETDDMNRVEFSLHYWYRDYRLIGEWFDLLPLFGLTRNDYLEVMMGANTVKHEYSYSINVHGIEKSHNRRIWIRNPETIKSSRKKRG